MSIKNNTTSLQNLLNAVNALPETGGIELPKLTNPGTADTLLLNKQLINSEGKVVTGTFTIDEELNTQDNLIAQITTALEGKVSGEQATPEILINNSNGLITATAGTKSSTYQLAFQPAKTITPGTTSQVAVSSGYYTGGNIIVAAVPTQTKSVTPTAVVQNITPDSGKFLSKVTVAGDSNLVASNIKSGVSIFGVNGTLQEGGSDDGNLVDYSENEDAMVVCALSVYSNDRVKNIGGYAFYGYYALSSVNFPAVGTIGSYAFGRCSRLTSVNFPALKNIGSYAFISCSSLASANFPAVITIGNNAFINCSSLTSVNFPAATIIGNYVFSNCSNLTSVNFPVATSISGIGTFAACYRLSSFQLGASSVCTLANSVAFRSTPFTGYSAYFSSTPHIYVPASLITAYQSATNWTYFSSYFSSIESLGPTLISFTIDNTEFQAEEGMTWVEWAESEYNPGNFVAYDNAIRNGMYLIYNVSTSDMIVENKVYTTVAGGGNAN